MRSLLFGKLVDFIFPAMRADVYDSQLFFSFLLKRFSYFLVICKL
jgi:hypothetical protein